MIWLILLIAVVATGLMFGEEVMAGGENGTDAGGGDTGADVSVDVGGDGGVDGGVTPESGTASKEPDFQGLSREETIKFLGDYKTQAEELKALKAEQAQWRAGQGQRSADPQQAPRESNAQQKALDFLDKIQDTDIVDGKQLKEIVNGLKAHLEESTSKNIRSVQSRLYMHDFERANPEWRQDINTYLPEVYKIDPRAEFIIKNSPNPLETGLSYARMMKAMKDGGKGDNGTDTAKQPADNVVDFQAAYDRIMVNQGKPKTADGAESQSGKGNIGVDFESMTDAQWRAYQRKMGNT